MKRVFKIVILIIFLIIALIYVTNVTSMPDSIILFQGENLSLQTVVGIYIKEVENNENVIQASSNTENSQILKKETVAVSLFNFIDLKEIDITTIPRTKVIPLGNTIGLKLYSDGVLVIGMSEIEGQKPYENSGIEEGDLIKYINNEEVSTTKELIECVNKCDGESVEIMYLRDGVEYTTSIEPAITSSNEYKLGLWVRDGAAGIGTVTYYEPETNCFAALGHGIVDSDTNTLISLDSGELVTTAISSITKGEEGKPRRNKGNNKKRINNRKYIFQYKFRNIWTSHKYKQLKCK